MTRAYKLTGLSPHLFYIVTLTARGTRDGILAESHAAVLLTTDLRGYLPLTLKN